MSDTKETEGYTTVELTLDNDEVIECAILTVYEAAGKEYIALLPLDENLEPNEAGDVYLYQYNETEDGEPDLCLMKTAGMGEIDFDRKFVAIKMHFGEPGNLAFLRPNWAKTVADFVKERGGKPFLTDCNTLYVGGRKNGVSHS